MSLDLSLLKELPELSANVTLEIRPLAPLSMVSEMLGSYYKSMKCPDKKMICGLFENILGWHIDLPMRKNIFKEYKAIRKKQKIEVVGHVSGSTYQPLLMDYFSINGKPKVKFQKLCFYKDLWNRDYRWHVATVLRCSRFQSPSIPLLRVGHAWPQVTCPNVVVDTRYAPCEAFLAVGREERARLAHRLSASASQSCIVCAGSPHASCKRCGVGICQPARSGWLRSVQSWCLIGVFFLGHRVGRWRK